MKRHFQIVWDRQALDHLKEILTHLGKHSSQAPKIVKKALLGRLDLIKTNPLICETDKLKITPSEEFRAFVVFSYRVSYQVKFDESVIYILRVKHTSREPLGY